MAVLILLDPSSAFDAIGHYILLHRLRSLYGISGSVLLWFESYLTGRTQTAIVNDKSSRRVFFGVREGSVLRPILFILYSTSLSFLSETHSVSNQSFADDTQVLHSCPPTKLLSTVLTMQTCISDVKTWMTQNKLKLNDDKSEAVLIKSNRTSFPSAQPTSLPVGSADSPFTTCARNLGFMISDIMCLDKHTSKVCRSAYVKIRRISSIRQYLTVEATKTLVCAFVLSKLDYCNSLLFGYPLYILRRLQKVQNSAAKLVFKSRRRDHVQPLLRALIGYRSKPE